MTSRLSALIFQFCDIFFTFSDFYLYSIVSCSRPCRHLETPNLLKLELKHSFPKSHISSFTSVNIKIHFLQVSCGPPIAQTLYFSSFSSHDLFLPHLRFLIHHFKHSLIGVFFFFLLVPFLYCFCTHTAQKKKCAHLFYTHTWLISTPGDACKMRQICDPADSWHPISPRTLITTCNLSTIPSSLLAPVL